MSDGTENTGSEKTSDGSVNTETGNGDNGQSGGASNTSLPKVEFSSEQQNKVQELIDSTHLKSKLEIEALKTKLERLEKNSVKVKETEKEKVSPDISEMAKAQEALVEEIAGLKVEKAENMNLKKTTSIMAAISKHSLVDGAIEQVTQLIESQIQYDEQGNLIVRGHNDAPMVNRKGEPMTVDEHIENWLSAHPHFLRASGSAGAGSQSAKGGAGSQKYDLSIPGTFASLPPEERKRLLEEGINVHTASGQIFPFKSVGNPFREARKKKVKGE